MKKILIIMVLSILLLSSVYATSINVIDDGEYKTSILKMSGEEAKNFFPILSEGTVCFAEKIKSSELPNVYTLNQLKRLKKKS